jgi:hypothetical protein
MISSKTGAARQDELPAPYRTPMEEGKAGKSDDIVMSSVYREYLHPQLSASLDKSMSSCLVHKYANNGELGLPCGRQFSRVPNLVNARIISGEAESHNRSDNTR